MSSISKLPPIFGADPVRSAAQPAPQTAKRPAAAPDFGAVLDQQLDASQPLKFSAHAQNRLLHRNISLSPQQMNRLNQGVSDAQQKGARDSLVMLDNLAFVVSVRNRTVVTALDNPAQSGAVFTQIDSAVIA